MDLANTHPPSTDGTGQEGLQSPHSPAQSSAEDHSTFQSPGSPAARTYSPAASYSAPAATQYSHGSPLLRARDELQSPQSPSADPEYSPVASYSAGPAQNSGAPSSFGFSHRSPAQSSALYSPNSPGGSSAPVADQWGNFMGMSSTAHRGGDVGVGVGVGAGVGGRFSPNTWSDRPTPHASLDDDAAVRAPTGRARSLLGPVGSGSAVPVWNFTRYAEEGAGVSLPPLPRESSLEPGHPRQQRNRPHLGFDALPPGSDPPTQRIANFSWNNAEKFTDTNIPERFEQFILAEGEKKCVGKADTRTPNTAIFTFAKEDHTLGNLLKNQLMKDNRVLFSGYKVAHPLVPNFELRVQTDGSITPKEALVSCCRTIVVDLDTLSREFTKEFELRKIVTGDAKD